LLVEDEAYLGVPWDLEPIVMRHLRRAGGAIEEGKP
jgi:hypothetical protein